MKKIAIYFLIIFTYINTACNEEFVGQPGTDSIAPGIVQNPIVENLPGGAKISYDLPDDPDLLYIKAVYTLNGKLTNTSATLYEKSLIIEGFGSTEEQKVYLYSVDRSGNESIPLEVCIHPTTPPVQLLIQSMKIQNTWGGIAAQWVNENQSDVAIYLLVADSLGEMKEAEVVYSNKIKGEYKFRGFDDQERNFGIFIRDRWDNYSDTIYQICKPLYEVEIKGLKRTELPGDNTTGNFDNLFNGIVGNQCWHTAYGKEPKYFTIDLGKSVKLSRYILWHRMGKVLYAHHNPKYWEVWGCNDPKFEIYDEAYWIAETGGFKDDWTMLLDCYSFKPSGEGPVTEEDKLYAEKGFEFEFPLDAEPVRYLRFHIKETWGGGSDIHISEIKVWGEGKE